MKKESKNLIKINKKTSDQVTNLVLYTIFDLKKQVLIFNNSKRSCEATAERIMNAIKTKVEFKDELEEISNKILKTFSSPTKQCLKLSKCIKKGVAFHHSGLVSKQRELVEDGFKNGYIKVISSTPTLAAGLNLPAYKVIVKDYKRYSSRGFNDIPVLEYHQMSGRAGRPGKESVGKSILCITNEDEKDRVVDKYINGSPEEIISKLAVEPTLKMHILSLISMDLINTKEEIKHFFSNTLYAKQYQDLDALNYNIFRIIDILIDYGFVNQDDDYYMATRLGKKVSELYLNPDTANFFLEHLDSLVEKFTSFNPSKYNIYSLFHFIVNVAEMRPLFRVKKVEEERYSLKIENIQNFVEIKFDPFEDDFEDYLASIKTTDIIIDWINEAHEDYIFEKYGVTPGELNYKLDIIDWLIFALGEISLIKKKIFFKNLLEKIRIRIKKGVKEELIPLLSIKGIGRIRARKLYNQGFKSLNDIRVALIEDLSKSIPINLAKKIKKDLSFGIEGVENRIIPKIPSEVKNRALSEVDDLEIINLVENYNQFEKEKQEKQRSLENYF